MKTWLWKGRQRRRLLRWEDCVKT